MLRIKSHQFSSSCLVLLLSTCLPSAWIQGPELPSEFSPASPDPCRNLIQFNNLIIKLLCKLLPSLIEQRCYYVRSVLFGSLPHLEHITHTHTHTHRYAETLVHTHTHVPAWVVILWGKWSHVIHNTSASRRVTGVQNAGRRSPRLVRLWYAKHAVNRVPGMVTVAMAALQQHRSGPSNTGRRVT